MNRKETSMTRNKILAILLALVLCFASLECINEEASLAVASSTAVVGAVVGGGAFIAIGTGGLTIASAVAGIGAAPFIAAGAVAGLAGYGVYSMMSPGNTA